MGVRVDGAAGPLALGAKGSVRDRLTPTGRFEGSALGRYIVSLRWRCGRPLGRHFFMPPLAAKTGQPGFRPLENHTTALRARKSIPPLVAGATTLPGGKHVTGFVGRLQLPYESSFFATPASGGTITLAYCRAIYEESVSRCFILPPLAGAVRRSPDRGCICRRQIIQQNSYFAI